MSEKDNNESHGQLTVFGTIFLIIVVSFLVVGGIIIIARCTQADTGTSSAGSSASNGYHIEVGRRANNNDILFDSAFDFSSLGVKYTITPQSDINMLVIELRYFDDDNNELSMQEKNLGNVKKGVQVSFSVSLLDISLSTAWNTRYVSCRVVDGRVPFFS